MTIKAGLVTVVVALPCERLSQAVCNPLHCVLSRNFGPASARSPAASDARRPCARPEPSDVRRPGACLQADGPERNARFVSSTCLDFFQFRSIFALRSVPTLLHPPPLPLRAALASRSILKQNRVHQAFSSVGLFWASGFWYFRVL